MQGHQSEKDLDAFVSTLYSSIDWDSVPKSKVDEMAGHLTEAANHSYKATVSWTVARSFICYTVAAMLVTIVSMKTGVDAFVTLFLNLLIAAFVGLGFNIYERLSAYRFKKSSQSYMESVVRLARLYQK